MNVSAKVFHPEQLCRKIQNEHTECRKKLHL